ncbi:hypothetical protein KIPB_006170 [Kipferlia bialata]|uniref:Uncharacterized protein n=1 Tax=Kipferlia bialata TaxID=797122 RepID=A0A9K3CYB1_9EUKA|nr:hypothetical protein KIPB_006170 [Kipferlia bialata]|eukprot:g6170.t1
MGDNAEVDSGHEEKRAPKTAACPDPALGATLTAATPTVGASATPTAGVVTEDSVHADSLPGDHKTDEIRDELHEAVLATRRTLERMRADSRRTRLRVAEFEAKAEEDVKVIRESIDIQRRMNELISYLVD